VEEPGSADCHQQSPPLHCYKIWIRPVSGSLEIRSSFTVAGAAPDSCDALLAQQRTPDFPFTLLQLLSQKNSKQAPDSGPASIVDMANQQERSVTETFNRNKGHKYDQAEHTCRNNGQPSRRPHRP
jgi:hypothetical protein